MSVDAVRTRAAEARPATLFLLSSLGVGGSEAKTVRLANSLARSGERVTLAWLGGAEDLSARLHDGLDAVRIARRGRFSWAAQRRLCALVEERGIAVIVAVNLYPTLYARICAALAKRPLRLVAALNTTDFGTRRERALLVLYRAVLRGFHRLIFGAEFQRRLWHERYRVGSPEASIVIYNGIDTERFRSPVAPAPLPAAWPAGRFVVGSIGQLRPEKGQLVLLHAIAVLRDRAVDVGLLLVGAGPQRPAVERETGQLGLTERVHLAGQVEDVRPWLARMQLFVLPSLSETFSNAALEAMADGVPVIASRVGGMPEMLQHGGGRVVAPGDPHALASCIADLAADAPLRKRLAREARHAVESHFTWDETVRRYRASVCGDTPCEAPIRTV